MRLPLHAIAACLVVMTSLARAGSPVALSPVFTVLPGITGDVTATTNGLVDGPGGSMGIVTLELDDQFDSVQIGVLNQTAQGWGIDRIVAAPSASYGRDPAFGAAAYDLDGNPIAAMLPVQWGNKGRFSNPGGKQPGLVSLPLGEAAAAGTTTLAFASTAAGPAYGNVAPQKGWEVADGLGCIAPHTKIKSVTGTTITLAGPVRAPGCAAGQALYFQSTAFGPFSQAIPPADPKTGATSITFSDWLPLSSLPRADAGVSVGASVGGDGIAPGTTVAGFGWHAIGLSQPVASTMSPRTPITVTVDGQTSGRAMRGRTLITLQSTGGIVAGQTVSGDNAIAPNTHVIGTAGQTITIDTPLQQDLGDGTTLAFTAALALADTAKRGDTSLHVPSLSSRPILHLRVFTSPGNPPTVHSPSCLPDPQLDQVPCETPLGLPPIYTLAGGQNGSLPIDGINFVSSVGAGQGSPILLHGYPTFFFRFHGAHAGATLLACGGFQMSGGTGSVSGVATFARVGAAAAETANLPITVVNTASANLDTSVNFANCSAWLQTIQPNLLVQQDYSNHNGATIADYMAQVQAIATQALAQGAQPITYLGYPEATDLIGELPISGAVHNSPSVPLLTGANASVSGGPYLVQGTGVPAGTTGSIDNGGWVLTLSRPVSLAAGTILNFGFQVASTAGTEVTLTQPAFTTQKHTPVYAPGSSRQDRISIVQGSVSAKLSKAASIPPGSLLKVNTHEPKNGSEYTQAAADYRARQNEPWNAVQLDGMAAVSTDPVNATELCRGCTTQGSYVNDYGNGLIADALVPILQQATGQQ